ncbi:hypothetical protein [Silvibacterium sp.]|uniref:hypothetical protein n=1 Tax=Silvibacterium sp. TaxID=1964179 RepID=UPI0039E3E0F8
MGSLLLLGSARALFGQQAPQPADLAVTYSAGHSLEATSQTNFWMQGGSIELGSNTWHGLGAAANVSGFHASSIGASGIPLSLVTATFGPRYRWRSQHRRTAFSPYGEALLGIANGFDSVFPAPRAAQTSADGMALQLGGGIDYDLGHRFGIRVLHASWLRTYLPNGTDNLQNTLVLGSGVVLHFGS